MNHKNTLQSCPRILTLAPSLVQGSIRKEYLEAPNRHEVSNMSAL